MSQSTPPTAVPLFDLARVLEPHRADLHAALERCLTHGQLVLGPEVAAFEKQLGAWTGAGHVVGVSSGTDALLATFMALQATAGDAAPLQPGDEVITTAYSFIATATSILRAGLRPVFVDIAPGRFFPDLQAYERAWSPRTRAVLSVHLFGEPQPLDDLLALCRERGAVLVEDCAQSIGARLPDGRHVGRAGIAGTFSFFPAKNLGALGDGGAVVTDDALLGAKVREKRQHGCAVRYQFEHLGGNFRLDALQAAFLGVLLPQLAGWIARRREHALGYDAALAPLVRVRPERLRLPAVDLPGHAWNQYVVRTPERDALRAALDAAKVGTAIYYPSALHHQGALSAANPPACLAESERACAESLALPIYPGLTERERDRVVEVVAAWL